MASVFDLPGIGSYLGAQNQALDANSSRIRNAIGIMGLQNNMRQQAMEEQAAPLRMGILQEQLNSARNPAPTRVDLGGSFGLMDRSGNIIGQIPKSATPDAVMGDTRARDLHATPSGSAILGSQTTLQTHATPSGAALLTDARTRSEGAANRGVSLRGQDLTNARALEAASRDSFTAPTEVTGPDGRPLLVVQNRRTGQMVDANTLQTAPQIGPKIGETAQKQQTGVQTTKDAIDEYRRALAGFSTTDILNPNARARMGTIYNNMLLQAKEAYNLGVLNGPDYMILQEVITNPASMTGAITSKRALDDQAAKLDEIMGRVGARVTQTQSGVTPPAPSYSGPDRRGAPAGFRVLGVER